MEEKKAVRIPATVHNVILESRRKLSLSGVTDIESFNDEQVMLQTEMGAFEIKGEDLHMNRLNLESGEVIIEGEIISMLYADDTSPGDKKGFFSRLFR